MRSRLRRTGRTTQSKAPNTGADLSTSFGFSRRTVSGSQFATEGRVQLRIEECRSGTLDTLVVSPLYLRTALTAFRPSAWYPFRAAAKSIPIGHETRKLRPRVSPRPL